MKSFLQLTLLVCLLLFTPSQNGMADSLSSTLKLTSPNGGQVWHEGKRPAVEWRSDEIDSVKIDFTTDGGQTWRELATADAAGGTYIWKIPAIDSDQCLVRISDVSDSTIFDVSDSFFTLSTDTDIPFKIVILGSSTAFGTGPIHSDSAWVKRYKRYVYQLNTAAKVWNLAIGGYTTYHIMPNDFSPPGGRPAPSTKHNITKALSLDADAIIINLPSNDAACGYTIKEQLANYDSVLARATEKNVPVWIATTQPRNLSDVQRENLKAVRDSTFSRFGGKAIDFWNGLANADGTIKSEYNSGDGVHLNDAAHGILYRRVVEKKVLANLRPGVESIVIKPAEYTGALRNPLKGFTDRGTSEDNEWATLRHTYIKWNEIENDSSDTIEKIIDFSDDLWKDVEKTNVKVIPRVYLHWSGDRKYWPADMQQDDYSSPQFVSRVKRLVYRLGKAWDKDSRVAHIEMGIIGKWGEHHSPGPTGEMQTLLGQGFRDAFPHKKIMVRHADEFEEYGFGIYWDSWAHWDQINTHGKAIERAGDRWKTAMIGGEVAYNWGQSDVQPGDDPTDTMVDPDHRDFLIYTLRWLHGTQLRWVADYDQSNAEARAGAEEVQKVFGYRYIIDEVHYPSRIETGQSFDVSFSVKNSGSAPFYYDWPVELALLDENRNVAWSATFNDVDIRTWLPGDEWDKKKSAWDIEPQLYPATGSFKIDGALDPGKYTLALAVLDPAGMNPSLRFAVQNYFTGGYHPMGYIGIGTTIDKTEIDSTEFDDPYLDKTLSYEFDPDLVHVSDKKQSETMPSQFQLRQNYPNPFNPLTTIEYSLAENSKVSLAVFNSRGRRVATPVSHQKQTAGTHSIKFNAESLPSGLYLYRLTAENKSAIGKMLLIR